MASITHADIIPLIGGMSLGSEAAFGTKPEYFVSWDDFWANDRNIVNYYDNDVPYYSLTKDPKFVKKVDVVSSTCPCAGLSLLSGKASPDNPKNSWMYHAAQYILRDVRPEVYWGENAPQLAGAIGAPVRERLRQIGLENGYSFSIYTTKSLLHGVPQVRARSFYFFWRGDRVPLLEYYATPHRRIEDVIAKDAKGNSQTDPINGATPSEDPYYRFLLEEVLGGLTHREFMKQLELEKARNTVISYIHNELDADWKRVQKWFRAESKKTDDKRVKELYRREIAKCDRRMAKLADDKGYMHWGTAFAKGYIGAFVGHLPLTLTHPVRDRYITYREAMTIMGLPQDFQLMDASKRTANIICQNVPVQTARDMASEVRAYLEGKRPTVDARYLVQRNEQRRHEVVDRAPQPSNLEEVFAA